MNKLTNYSVRTLIPRWRFSSHIYNLAEFSSNSRINRNPVLSRKYLEEKLLFWQHFKSTTAAIELVSCGLNGQWFDEIKPAVDYLSEFENELSLPVRNLILNLQEKYQNHLNDTPKESINWLVSNASGGFDPLLVFPFISESRRKLRRNPRNVLAWLDMARAYSILGVNKKSAICIERALYLAPCHRYVLRAATRLFVHLNKKERAYYLVVNNPRTSVDPWLIATELSLAKLIDVSPKFLRKGRELAESNRFEAKNITELTSAIGTFFFYENELRLVRKNIKQSLISPTDNSVAQAHWISKHYVDIPFTCSDFKVPFGYEARTWRDLSEGNWESARSECLNWLNYEPFSCKPAEVGSYIGISLINNFKFAELCAKVGIKAHSDSPKLLNNLTIALACQDKREEAKKYFNKINIDKIQSRKYVYIATKGLLHFREKEYKKGRLAFEIAEKLAPDESSKNRIALFRAREELSANTTNADECVQKSLKIKFSEHENDGVRIQELLSNQYKKRNVCSHFVN